jgi:hypothetical protein
LSDDSVTGAPLVLDFQKIFLRQAISPEKDIEFSTEDLLGWADYYSRGLQ